MTGARPAFRPVILRAYHLTCGEGRAIEPEESVPPGGMGDGFFGLDGVRRPDGPAGTPPDGLRTGRDGDAAVSGMV